jgi:hypothetical protein
MADHSSDYEDLLATFSCQHHALELLRHYRPYFEKIPSIRRSAESVIPIPLPTVQVRLSNALGPSGIIDSPTERRLVDCDIAFLMCDPDWQIKTGVEIAVFIHRPGEEFSDLLRRWRHTQITLGSEYTWDMPLRYQHMLCEGTDHLYPLFVLLETSHARISRGLKGAGLPFLIQPSNSDRSSGLPVSDHFEAV